MLTKLLAKIFGTKNERIIKGYLKTVEVINSLEPNYIKLTDEDLKAQTIIFRKRLSDGASLNSILPEAFAVVREASKRALGMRPFDVQLIGGIAMNNGAIAEMKTGEGKTLCATLTLYLNSLESPCHLVTVNDYLAKRDAEWMMPIYSMLGVTAGFLQNNQSDSQRKKTYSCDIIYGTNSEFGFDYLRDNMKFNLKDFVQGKLSYALVDEVDSILIDEARTPLIISGPSDKDSGFYQTANNAVKRLVKTKDGVGDYDLDEKSRSVMLTETGIDKVEQNLNTSNLYAAENVLTLHHVQQALKANTLFKRDVDYMVTDDGEVLIVDEFTGRALPGRRFSDGLHQAIEAKEGVEIEQENQTLATITLQNYFRMYKKLGGMTGTAETDAVEFHKIYNLDVVTIPTHRPMVRVDEEDVIFLGQDAKYSAVVDDIKACYKSGQPVLVGTASIEASELLSFMLKKSGIPHNVLNAKQHEKEAEIIKEAGEKNRVTISTSMAGRGTDIKLGAGVAEIGGLRVIGTERYENRRIDDQLRGRSGRQGDPGSSKFYISLEDDLMRIFGGDKTKEWMQKWGGMEEHESIESSWVSGIVKSNQEKQERHHFDTRKHLLEYDDVMNQQRNVIYAYRRRILASTESLNEFLTDVIKNVVSRIFSENSTKSSDVHRATQAVSELIGISTDVLLESDSSNFSNIKDLVLKNALKAYLDSRASIPKEMLYEAEKWMLLSLVDYSWKTHLQNLDHLKEGIGLRGYGQKNPLYEYKKESFDEFIQMINQTQSDIVAQVFKIKSSDLSESQLIELKKLEQKSLEDCCDDASHSEHKNEEEISKKKASPAVNKKGGQNLKKKKK